MSKGDTPRPFSITTEDYTARFAATFAHNTMSLKIPSYVTTTDTLHCDGALVQCNWQQTERDNIWTARCLSCQKICTGKMND